MDRASKGDRPLFVELDTDIRGACVFLAALAEVNVLDCLRRPELRADLFDRLGRPDGFKYRVEQPDTWTAFSVGYGLGLAWLLAWGTVAVGRAMGFA